MVTKFIEAAKRKIAIWLRQGIAPQRLALTLALGFAIGCIPVIGVTSGVCFVVAIALRLNLPAIQAANWVAMPMQVALIVPFVHLGRRLIGFGSGQPIEIGALLHSSPSVILARMGSLTGQAMLAWLVVAIPMVALITLILTKVLRHIPAVAAAEFVE
jgi:uncharacterized protein (DUF2062 family)